ncbi:MAG: hypothetical protein VKP57_07970 [Candidatus Sericytochromatia bacterium]|nr:hypothetical protein [Candidatus Sericytochromatia bacterium]
MLQRIWDSIWNNPRPVSREELLQRTPASPSTVDRALRQGEREGIIRQTSESAARSETAGIRAIRGASPRPGGSRPLQTGRCYMPDETRTPLRVSHASATAIRGLAALGSRMGFISRDTEAGLVGRLWATDVDDTRIALGGTPHWLTSARLDLPRIPLEQHADLLDTYGSLAATGRRMQIRLKEGQRIESEPTADIWLLDRSQVHCLLDEIVLFGWGQPLAVPGDPELRSVTIPLDSIADLTQSELKTAWITPELPALMEVEYFICNERLTTLCARWPGVRCIGPDGGDGWIRVRELFRDEAHAVARILQLGTEARLPGDSALLPIVRQALEDLVRHHAF